MPGAGRAPICLTPDMTRRVTPTVVATGNVKAHGNETRDRAFSLAHTYRQRGKIGRVTYMLPSSMQGDVRLASAKACPGGRR